MNIKWTNEEKEFVRNNSNVLKDKDLAAELSKLAERDVKLETVRKLRQRMGIKKKQGRGICRVIND